MSAKCELCGCVERDPRHDPRSEVFHTFRAIAPELTIRDAQQRQPWTVPYSHGVKRAERGAVPHILASHDVLHAAKTVGKLAAVFEALDHRSEPITGAELQVVKDMSADLLSEALRLANLYEFDLATELRRRVREKNGVEL